jgi:hypothetical protein
MVGGQVKREKKAFYPTVARCLARRIKMPLFLSRWGRLARAKKRVIRAICLPLRFVRFKGALTRRRRKYKNIRVCKR